MSDAIGCPTHPAGTFADLSHIKAAVLILVLFAAQHGYPEPQVQAKAMKNQGELSQSGLVVTVIDDDFAVRNALKFWLEVEGLTVRSYASGAELLSAGDLDRCDCFVVDQKMPAMSGLDLIAQLRDRDFTAPAILITSHPSVSLRERAEKADVPIMEKALLEYGLLAIWLATDRASSACAAISLTGSSSHRSRSGAAIISSLLGPAMMALAVLEPSPLLTQALPSGRRAVTTRTGHYATERRGHCD